MAQQKIIVTIPRKGLAQGKVGVKVEADGYEGVGCSVATRLFQNAIGSVKSEEHKEAMFYQEAQVEKVHEGTHGE